MVMIALRKALDWVFTQRELKILDDIMPDTIRRNEEELRLGDAVSQLVKQNSYNITYTYKTQFKVMTF